MSWSIPYTHSVTVDHGPDHDNVWSVNSNLVDCESSKTFLKWDKKLHTFLLPILEDRDTPELHFSERIHGYYKAHK